MKIKGIENRRGITGLEISGGECTLQVVDFERIMDEVLANQLDPEGKGVF